MKKMAEQRKGRRGFSSSVFAALATTLLVTTIAALVSVGAYEKNVLLLAESQKTNNHFLDSKDFLNGTLSDAVVDSAWASQFGCFGANQFCDILPQKTAEYFANSTNALNGGFAAVNYSGLSVLCADAPPDPEYNASYEITSSFVLSAGSKNVWKKEGVSFHEFADVYGDGISFKVRVRSESSTTLAELSVSCS